ncbi:hypothetical protein KA005_74480 [bacterium]|nr:hypothetical protein [bacterium]
MVTTLTEKWLIEQRACSEGIEWLSAQPNKSMQILFDICIKSKDPRKLEWASWVIAKKLSEIDKVRYAVFAAQQVIDIYEKIYPEDNRPREAIKAAKKYIQKSSQKNAVYAADAADGAAYAALCRAHAALCPAHAAHAAYAAAHAAHAAYAAAYAAAGAAYAADAAAGAAAYAAAGAAGAEKMKIKILKYGFQLLKKKIKER